MNCIEIVNVHQSHTDLEQLLICSSIQFFGVLRFLWLLVLGS